MQRLAVQMEQQRQEDNKALEVALRKLEEAQKEATDQSESDMKRIEEIQKQMK